MAEPEEIEAEQKKLEAKYNPIMMRVYQAGGAPGGPSDRMPGGMPTGAHPAGAGAGNVEDLD